MKHFMAYRVLEIACGATILAGVLAPAGLAAPPTGPPPALVRVGVVKKEQVQNHRLVMGSARTVRRTVVAAEEAGLVIQAPPEAGTAVQLGSVLAKLRDNLLRIQRDAAAASIRQAQATVQERQSQVAMAQRELLRMQTLVDRGAGNTKELEDGRDRQTVAQARQRQATATLQLRQAQLTEHNERISRAKVTAPFDGVVVRKHTELGQWLQPGDPVAEIVEIAPIHAVLDVPQSMVQHVVLDSPIEILIKAIGQRRVGRVYRVVPDADAAARTFPVLVQLPNENHLIKPGMTVSAELPTGRSSLALTVPRDAVTITSTGSWVYVNRQGKAAPVKVAVRFGAADRFVVEGDLQVGETVVVEGNERLIRGQPLRTLGARKLAP